MTQHDHDGGLRRDLPLLTRRRLLVAGLALAGAAGGLTFLRGGPGMAGEANLSATGADGALCLKDPAETNGPYPADGTNSKDGQTVNVLTQNGVVRQDLRPCFNGLEGTAPGVPLELEITLVNVGGACAPLQGHAIYLWHADAEGHYSLYDLPQRNWLRGVVVTDAAGKARVTTIVPGCYDGRWPHIHFEVFASLDAAVSGRDALLTSQFAFPEAEVARVYASDAGYPQSGANLGRVTLAGDNVFGDNTAEQIAAQTLQMQGDPSTGYVARVTVGVA